MNCVLIKEVFFLFFFLISTNIKIQYEKNNKKKQIRPTACRLPTILAGLSLLLVYLTIIIKKVNTIQFVYA